MKKIIILGASGYIGQRLIKSFLGKYELHLFSRNKRKLSHFENESDVYLYDISLDESNRKELKEIFLDSDVVFYLIHSMSEEDSSDFLTKEKRIASFISKISDESNVGKIVYLGGLGILNDNKLSKHLLSRQLTGDSLRSGGKTPVVEFRAGIIIGAGGSSFEIIRTLATKLPIIPVFFKKEGLCETIFVDNVISYLCKSVNYDSYNNKILEIGNGETFTYSELVQLYAKIVLKKKLYILNLSFLEPLIGPKIIGSVIAFMTGQPKELIIPLIYGVKNDAIVTEKYSICKNICKEDDNHRTISLELSYKLAADRQNKGKVKSVWDTPINLSHLKQSPRHFFSTQEKEGLLYEERYIIISEGEKERVFNEFLNIGNKESGYWSPYFLWKARGIIDRMLGGCGVGNDTALNRQDLHIGDRIDFWTVEELVNTDEYSEFRLISEMKTPGEAWLQFKIVKNIECEGKLIFYLRAFFEPHGITGYLYWYSLYVIHKFIFSMMIKKIYNNAQLLSE